MNAVALPVTLRGKAAISDMRELFDQLETVTGQIESHEAREDWTALGDCQLSHAEVADVLQQRKQDILRQLENKGIRIAPDPVDVVQPTTTNHHQDEAQ